MGQLMLLLEIVRGRKNSRSPPMGCDASWTISVGLRTAKLDHFFMAAPYRFFLACCLYGERCAANGSGRTQLASYVKGHP
jgi:hypothetical protein